MFLKDRLHSIIIIAVITALFLTGAAPSFAYDTEDAPQTDGTSVIMMDSLSGDVLYAKNPQAKRDPASVTKILTCLVVLENMNLTDEVTVTEDSSKVGINIAMQKGEVLTVEQLLYALMLPSANDAARVLAIATGGSIENFCDMMNARAKECGAKNTHFTNPNGLNLPGQENHKTTAYDLAMITRQALANDKFREIVSTRKYIIPATNKSSERKLITTDPLLGSKKSVEVDGKKIPLKYEKATGVKTGTTSSAGNCFVASAKDGDMELIVVTLNSGDMTRFTDAIRLFDYGFEKFDTVVDAKAGEEAGTMKVRYGKSGSVSIGYQEALAYTKLAGDDASGNGSDTVASIKYNTERLDAPVKKGTVVGEVTVTGKDSGIAHTVKLVTLENVGEGGPLSHIGIPDDRIPIVIAVILTILAITIVLILMRRRHKKAGVISEMPEASAEAQEETAASASEAEVTAEPYERTDFDADFETDVKEKPEAKE